METARSARVEASLELFWLIGKLPKLACLILQALSTAGHVVLYWVAISRSLCAIS